MIVNIKLGHQMDLMEKLKKLVGTFGMINQKRGGFEISIKDSSKFPMYEICQTLLMSDFDVWVVQDSDNQIQIVSNPKRVKR